MSLLPSKPDTSPADAEPRVIGVDSDDADDVISALSSETARELLAEIHEEPAPPSELADRVDTSLQNAQYHLEKLQSAGAVSVVDTAYSAKGREMDVYAPADQPLVIFAGDEEGTTGLRAALSRLIGGLGILGLGSLVVQQLYGGTTDDGTAPTDGAGAGAEGVGAPSTPTGGETLTPSGDSSTVSGTFDVTNEATESVPQTVENVTTDFATQTVENTTTDTVSTIAETTASTATDTAPALAGVEPGLLFFAGGLLILSLWLGVWYVRNR